MRGAGGTAAAACFRPQSTSVPALSFGGNARLSSCVQKVFVVCKMFASRNLRDAVSRPARRRFAANSGFERFLPFVAFYNCPFSGTCKKKFFTKLFTMLCEEIF